MAFSSAEIFEAHAMDASVVRVPSFKHLSSIHGKYRVIQRKGRGTVVRLENIRQYHYRQKDDYRASKGGVVRAYTCGRCGSVGHGKRTCKARP